MRGGPNSPLATLPAGRHCIWVDLDTITRFQAAHRIVCRNVGPSNFDDFLAACILTALAAAEGTARRASGIGGRTQ